MRRTLEKFPNTLLGSDERDYFYDSVAGEYFFDRDPALFRYVLAYYRSVSLYRTVCTCPCRIRLYYRDVSINHKLAGNFHSRAVLKHTGIKYI